MNQRMNFVRAMIVDGEKSPFDVLMAADVAARQDDRKIVLPAHLAARLLAEPVRRPTPRGWVTH